MTYTTRFNLDAETVEEILAEVPRIIDLTPLRDTARMYGATVTVVDDGQVDAVAVLKVSGSLYRPRHILVDNSPEWREPTPLLDIFQDITTACEEINGAQHVIIKCADITTPDSDNFFTYITIVLDCADGYGGMVVNPEGVATFPHFKIAEE